MDNVALPFLLHITVPVALVSTVFTIIVTVPVIILVKERLCGSLNSIDAASATSIRRRWPRWSSIA